MGKNLPKKRKEKKESALYLSGKLKAESPTSFFTLDFWRATVPNSGGGSDCRDGPTQAPEP
jgi:hypothetical protein